MNDGHWKECEPVIVFKSGNLSVLMRMNMSK